MKNENAQVSLNLFDDAFRFWLNNNGVNIHASYDNGISVASVDMDKLQAGIRDIARDSLAVSSNEKKKWKHEGCTLQSRLLQSGGLAETIMWCNNHQERIVTKPL